MGKVIFRIANTNAELQQCFAIRHSVFVEEQKMFEKTDIPIYGIITPLLLPLHISVSLSSYI